MKQNSFVVRFSIRIRMRMRKRKRKKKRMGRRMRKIVDAGDSRGGGGPEKAASVDVVHAWAAF